MHIPDRERCNWLRERIEMHEPTPYSAEKKMHILDRLAWSELFEGALLHLSLSAKSDAVLPLYIPSNTLC